MPDRHLILNPGLARCGTTTTAYAFGALPGCSTPRGVKELKYLMGTGPLADYPGKFTDPGAAVLFESSPPYMQNGAATLQQVLARLAELRAAGWKVSVLVLLRNLLRRAFSHYWHDIASHHALYGRQWAVSQPGDPRRFGQLFARSFPAVLADPREQPKFLPDVAGLIRLLIAALGETRVLIGHTAALGPALTDFLDRRAPGLRPRGGMAVARLPPAQEAVYLPGGPAGQQVMLETAEGPRPVAIPPGRLLLVSRRRTELLTPGMPGGQGGQRGQGTLTAEDLPRIAAAAAHWTRRQATAALPPAVLDHLAAQTAAIAALPEACFLAGQRAALLEDLARLPAHLQIEPPLPEAEALTRLTEPLHPRGSAD